MSSAYVSKSRIARTITSGFSSYWNDHKSDKVAYGITVRNSNSGQEFVTHKENKTIVYYVDPVVEPPAEKSAKFGTVLSAITSVACLLVAL